MVRIPFGLWEVLVSDIYLTEEGKKDKWKIWKINPNYGYRKVK